MSARRAGTLAVAGVLATALLVVVITAWASSIGPSDVLRGNGPSPAGTPTETASEAPPPAGPPRLDLGERASGTPWWVRSLAFLVEVAVLVAVVVLATRFVVVPVVRSVRRFRWRRRRRRRARRRPGEVAFTVVAPPEAVAREMLADADAQRRLLEEDADPRNAVVECWHRFETQGAAAGIERHPWETSSEYTLRVLDLVEAYQPAVTRLGELYREARFSEHDVTETCRRAALEALDRIHRTIGVPA
jgi:hypothetical protein